MKIIYAVCSWGLGHATRSLPVIRKLIAEGNELTIISNGRTLELLKNELGDNIEYFDIPDYPMLLSENSRQFMAKSFVYWPSFVARMISGLPPQIFSVRRTIWFNWRSTASSRPKKLLEFTRLASSPSVVSKNSKLPVELLYIVNIDPLLIH